ncbi:hypothetical protein [Acuticoccus sp.]|uniref:hypothetical protein n=1 Tax=Acuticoccus sp. TaxID=1904378 RepID=UPI003B51BB60
MARTAFLLAAAFVLSAGTALAQADRPVVTTETDTNRTQAGEGQGTTALDAVIPGGNTVAGDTQTDPGATTSDPVGSSDPAETSETNTNRVGPSQ